MRYSAAFLDRDGTLVRDPGYLDDPSQVELVEGAAGAVAQLNARGIPVVVVTNQSGIGRGYYSEDDFRAVQREVERRLARYGCALDAVYYCPHAPEESCGCRKPELGLYREAAERFGISLAHGLYVGDKVTDVIPAARTGGTGFLVRTGAGEEAETERLPEGCRVADSLSEAVDRALGGATEPGGGGSDDG